MRVPTETEATLAIVSDFPDGITKALVADGCIGSFELSLEDRYTIHDQYFDTQDASLGNRSYALRLRSCDGRVLLALKGKGKRVGAYSTARLEIEDVWSPDTLGAIAGALKAQGVLSASTKLGSGLMQPVTVLRGMGLEILQDRTTKRQNFTVTAQGSNNRLAEISVDTVTYRLSIGGLTRHELEIEAKTEQGKEILDELIRALLLRFPGSLRLWRHSKLATGLALEQLARSYSVTEIQSSKGVLLPAVYDLIESLIARPRG